jgi:hypothetical protein
MTEVPPGTPEPTGIFTRAADEARRAADGVAEGLRRAGRWQRLRLAILGGWLAASLLAVFIAFPSSGPTNPIGAEVKTQRHSLLGQQILVRNDSDDLWTDVVIILDGTWRHAERSVRPHEQVVLSPSQFERNGEPAPADLRPRSITVQSREGRARFEDLK